MLELKKEIVTFKQGNQSIGNYYAKFRALWCELDLYLSPEPCWAKKQAKLWEDLHTFELLSGVNPGYVTVNAQVTGVFVHRLWKRKWLFLFCGNTNPTPDVGILDPLFAQKYELKWAEFSALLLTPNSRAKKCRKTKLFFHSFPWHPACTNTSY